MSRATALQKASMMNTGSAVTRPFVREPSAGSTLNVLGVTHIYKATALEMGGSFSLCFRQARERRRIPTPVTMKPSMF